MKAMKKQDVVRLLIDNGFYILRQGEHEVWANATVRVFLPRHGVISPGVMRDIWKAIRKSTALVA